MILLRCDVCKRTVENPKLMFSSSSPVALVNGTLLNPEPHVCVFCMVYRLKAVAYNLKSQCGADTESTAESVQKAKMFVVTDILVNPEEKPVVVPEAKTSSTVLPKLDRNDNGLRKNALPKPVFEGSTDIETVFKEALKDMKKKGVRHRVVPVHDSYGKYIGDASLDGKLNLWENYKSLVDLIPSYSGKIELSKHPNARHFDLVWNELINGKFVYVRVYMGAVSVYTYFGYSKEQVKFALKELNAKVLKIARKTPKVIE